MARRETSRSMMRKFMITRACSWPAYVPVWTRAPVSELRRRVLSYLLPCTARRQAVRSSCVPFQLPGGRGKAAEKEMISALLVQIRRMGLQKG